MPETKLVHMSQLTGKLQTIDFALAFITSSFPDYNCIAIAIIKGKMLTLSIYMPVSSSSSKTLENIDDKATEEVLKDNHSNMATSLLRPDKNITFGSLLTARCCFGIASINNVIYVVGTCCYFSSVQYLMEIILGGYNRSDCLDTIEEFDLVENKWKPLSLPMSTRRGRVSAAVVNDEIYICGGSDGQKELSTGECLDLKSMNKWTMIKELSTPLAHSGKLILLYQKRKAGKGKIFLKI